MLHVPLRRAKLAHALLFCTRIEEESFEATAGSLASVRSSREEGWAEGSEGSFLASDDLDELCREHRETGEQIRSRLGAPLSLPPLSAEVEWLRERGVARLTRTARRRVLFCAEVFHSDDEHLVRVDLVRGDDLVSLLLPDASQLELRVEHASRLLESPPEVEVDPRSLPIVWSGGSGAVLLHEAAGHPAEQSRFVHWPPWLTVREPDLAVPDDLGQQVPSCDLLREPVRAHRRWSYRDLPRTRMRGVVVETSGKGAASLPEEPHLEVHCVSGGTFDPLSDSVRLDVAVAFLVDRGSRRRLFPFALLAGREEIASALESAAGKVSAYPGVICSTEGERLPVSSASVMIVTRALRR